jgi:MFS family permease
MPAQRVAIYEMLELGDEGDDSIPSVPPPVHRSFWARTRDYFARMHQGWVYFVAVFLFSMSNFMLTMSLTIYLHSVFGISDTSAGNYYAIWGFVIFLLSFPAGLIIDTLPMRFSLMLGSFALAVSTLAFALSPFRWLTLGSMFTMMAVGHAFLGQVFPIVLDRYFDQHDSASTVAFAVNYAVMNLGAVVAGWTTDACLTLGTFNGYHLLFTLAAQLAILLFFVCTVYEYPRARPAPGADDKRNPRLDRETGRKKLFWLEFRTALKLSWTTLKGLVQQKLFWKLTLFNTFLTPVRSMFIILNSFFPNYMHRVYPNYPYGTVLSINPILIIFLTPLISRLTSRFLNSYGWIVVGSLISSVSSIWLWLWPSSSPVPLIAFVVSFTLGESISSARVGQYTVQNSPSDQKGVYGALIVLPASIGHTLAGVFSGNMLAEFCPDFVAYDEEEELEYRAYCSRAWFYFFIFSFTSFALLLISARYLNIEDAAPVGKSVSWLKRVMYTLNLSQSKIAAN